MIKIASWINDVTAFAWILPLLVFSLGLITRMLEHPGEAWREAFLRECMFWALCVLGLTEISSFFTAFGPMFLTVGWGVLAIGKATQLRGRGSLASRQWCGKWREIADWLTPARAALCAPLLVFPLITGILALGYAPNNFDAQTYHLARVMHWIARGSVAHYPTAITRQLYQGPWAEYVIAHFQILSGGDRFANLVQWFSWVGCMAGASWVARELAEGLNPGTKTRVQLASALAIATLPMAILQSSSAQTDLVESFWAITFSCFALRVSRAAEAGDDPCPASRCAGIALGFLLLTKGTGYLWAAPLLLLMAWSLRRRSLLALRAGIWILGIALLLNAPTFYRNWETFGNALGEPGEYRNEILDFRGLICGLAKDLVVHFGTPWPRANHALEDQVRWLHARFGLDASDPRNTWQMWHWEKLRFQVSALSFHEDFSGNPLQAIGIVGAAWILASRRKRLAPYVIPSLCAVGAGFLLFAWLLKWQLWISRLQLPFFVLAAPHLGLGFGLRLRRSMAGAIATILILGSVPYLAINRRHPLFGVFGLPRPEQYFISWSHAQASYFEVSREILRRGCKRVGLMLGPDTWEYPLWALTRFSNVRFRHVAVNNPSARYADPAEEAPCLLVGLDPSRELWLKIGSQTFRVLDSVKVRP